MRGCKIERVNLLKREIYSLFKKILSSTLSKKLISSLFFIEILKSHPMTPRISSPLYRLGISTTAPVSLCTISRDKNVALLSTTLTLSRRDCERRMQIMPEKNSFISSALLFIMNSHT